MEFLFLLGTVIVLLGVALLAMGVRVIFHRSGKFPETSAGHNRDMRKLGITCPRHEEIKCWTKKPDQNTCATCYEHARG